MATCSPGHEACSIDRGKDHFDRLVVRLQVGSKPPFVADGGVVAPLGEHVPQRVKRLGPHPERLPKRGGADRDDHELLEVNVVVGMPAAVDDVHHRHRERHGGHAPEVLVQWQLRRSSRGFRHGYRDAEDGVRAEFFFERRTVLLDHQVVDVALVAGLLAAQQRGQHMLDVSHCVQHPLAAVAFLVAVSQLARFAGPSRGTRGDRRSPGATVLQQHLDFNGRVAPRVEDLLRENIGDLAHRNFILSNRVL